MTLRSLAGLAFCLLTESASAQPSSDSAFVRANYKKIDRQIPMRDGTKLYTVIYTPKDASPENRYPFLMQRTPYSAGPYGEANYTKRGPGPSVELSREKFIFVNQDVRGRYMSEGQFEEMTPATNGVNGSKKEFRRKHSRYSIYTGTRDDTTVKTSKWIKNLQPVGPTDESTDTYDTV